jgi:hypothetical protein
VTIAVTSRFKAGFIVTVANTLAINNTAVIIISTVATQSTRRSLLASGVQVSYKVESSSKSIGKILNDAIASGSFGNNLQRNTGTSVTALVSVIVTDITPTNMPSLMPNDNWEAVTGLRLGIVPVIIIAVVGFLIIFIFLILRYHYSGRKRHLIKKYNTVSVAVAPI